MQRVLFVCTGNICRSPSADGILRAKVKQAGLSHAIAVDSAGTQAFHVGESPDPRSVRAAAKRGYDLEALVARQVTLEDFEHFDWLFALDAGHEAHLQRMAPEEHVQKAQLFLPSVGVQSIRDVPDPYYGGAKGFEQVLDLLEEGCDRLLERLA